MWIRQWNFGTQQNMDFWARSQNCEKCLLASSCLSFCPSAWNISARTGRIFMKFDVWGLFGSVHSKSTFHYNRTRMKGTLHEDQHIFFIISRSFLLRMRNVSDMTEVFPCFSSVVRQMPGLNSQNRGTDRISSELLSFVLCMSLCYAIVFMLFCCYYVVLLLCCSVIICVVLCIDCVYCTTATGC